MEYQASGTAWQNHPNTNSVSVSSAVPVEVESPSRIRDGITLAEELLSTVHGTISDLEKRLDTVLQPVPPKNAELSGAKVQPPTSHVHGRLVIMNEGYESAVARLRDLIRRVEV